jgi:hypothetical protein
MHPTVWFMALNSGEKFGGCGISRKCDERTAELHG